MTERVVEVVEGLAEPDIYLYDFLWTRATYAQLWESPHVGDCRGPRSEAHDISVSANTYLYGELFATVEYLEDEQGTSISRPRLITFSAGDSDGEPGALPQMTASFETQLSSGSAACVRITPYHSSGFAYEPLLRCTPDACLDAAQPDEDGDVPEPTRRDASCRLGDDEQPDEDHLDPMDRGEPREGGEEGLDWSEGDDLNDDGCSVAPSGRSSGHTPWPLALLAATLWGVRTRRRE